ncbi:hypothetical protein [uncultured Cohaesibacter sp.]|uniref:hypothetical protein n=1 Tax=uncultured Cohaesibacter sp. TaxID=1002546 RepID=UPI002AA60C8A|nr:hypothetical protein [uncultured Cohaesibacter sp.]
MTGLGLGGIIGLIVGLIMLTLVGAVADDTVYFSTLSIFVIMGSAIGAYLKSRD